MNWKLALALSALVTSVAALAACGGTDDCIKSADKLTMCGVTGSTGAGGGGMAAMPMACMTPFDTCKAHCINNTPCSEINPATVIFTDCLKGCQSK
jgi:hypothetical protein